MVESALPPGVTRGVHVAGPVDAETTRQFCAHCGGLLATLEEPWPALTVPHTHYVEGCFVERGPTWQAMVFGYRAPTCQERQ